MQLEDMRDFRKKMHVKSSKGDKKGANKKSYKGKERLKGPCFNNYTLLSVPQTKILEETLSADLFPTPRKKPTTTNTNENKHYLYHRNLDHTTEDCSALRDKIEELIKASHLMQFMKKNCSNKSPHHQWNMTCNPRRTKCGTE